MITSSPSGRPLTPAGRRLSSVWRKIPGGGTELVFQRAVLAGLCVVACSSASAAQGVDGRWDAAVLANGVAVPFRFEIVTSGTRATGFFFDGTRKIESTSGQFDRGRLTV